MHAIIDTNHRIAFPPLPNAALLSAIQRCLDRDPRTRIGMQVGGVEWQVAKRLAQEVSWLGGAGSQNAPSEASLVWLDTQHT